MVINKNTNTYTPPKLPQKMDPNLWSKIPEELLEQILSCLPLKTFLYLQSTCKHFKSLTFSPSFISKHFSSSSSPSTTSFLLLSHPQFTHQYFLYNTNLNSWRAQFLSLSSILPPSATLISSVKGMLCFSVLDSNSFIICNLLARSSRTVKFPKHPFEFECFGMVLGVEGYKLFVICQDSRCSVFVYDSINQGWKNYRSQFDVNYRTQGVCFNSRLYFATRVPFGVTVFDFETGNWENLMTVSPRELVFGRLVSDGNEKLYLFGGIGNNGISRNLKIWELSQGGENWIEIGSVPDMMCRKLVSVCFHNYEHLYVFWHQEMICVCCYSWPEILYYKVSRRTWHWLPKCPSMPEKWSCGFKWFSFVPQLHPYV